MTEDPKKNSAKIDLSGITFLSALILMVGHVFLTLTGAWPAVEWAALRTSLTGGFWNDLMAQFFHRVLIEVIILSGLIFFFIDRLKKRPKLSIPINLLIAIVFFCYFHQTYYHPHQSIFLKRMVEVEYGSELNWLLERLLKKEISEADALEQIKTLANSNFNGEMGPYSLIRAASIPHPELLKVLLEKIKSRNPQIILSAINAKQSDNVKVLLQEEISIEPSWLEAAIQSQSAQIVKLIYDAGAQIPEISGLGYSLVMYLNDRRQTNLAEELVSLGLARDPRPLVFKESSGTISRLHPIKNGWLVTSYYARKNTEKLNCPPPKQALTDCKNCSETSDSRMRPKTCSIAIQPDGSWHFIDIGKVTEWPGNTDKEGRSYNIEFEHSFHANNKNSIIRRLPNQLIDPQFPKIPFDFLGSEELQLSLIGDDGFLVVARYEQDHPRIHHFSKSGRYMGLINCPQLSTSDRSYQIVISNSPHLYLIENPQEGGPTGEIQRLDLKCQADSKFRLRYGTGFTPPVQWAQAQNDGSILIHGDFTHFGGEMIPTLAIVTHQGEIDFKRQAILEEQSQPKISELNPRCRPTKMSLQSNGQILVEITPSPYGESVCPPSILIPAEIL